MNNCSVSKQCDGKSTTNICSIETLHPHALPYTPFQTLHLPVLPAFSSSAEDPHLCADVHSAGSSSSQHQPWTNASVVTPLLPAQELDPQLTRFGLIRTQMVPGACPSTRCYPERYTVQSERKFRLLVSLSHTQSSRQVRKLPRNPHPSHTATSAPNLCLLFCRTSFRSFIQYVLYSIQLPTYIQLHEIWFYFYWPCGNITCSF